MTRHSRRLAQLETCLTQRREIADAEGLKELAEIARAKIRDAIDRHKRGEPLPPSSASPERASPARDRLRERLAQTRERLMQFSDVRERMP
jgi:hypothetical protein